MPFQHRGQVRGSEPPAVREGVPMRTNVPVRMAAALAVAGMVAAARPATAQSSGDGFLFQRPGGAFVVRAGFDQPRARSDIFSFVTDQLTLRKSDFGGLSLAGEITAHASQRTDVIFGIAWSGTRTGSEYRDYVDNNDLPIEQTTSFERVPLTVGIRHYLVPPGEAVGHLAWVPSRYAPYVGAGIGAMWYQFRQTGDFIDLNTMNVFPDTYKSSDWTLTAHVNAGVDVSVGPRTFFTTEARYTWARGPVGADFSGFQRIDLSGLALTFGVGYRM
jgi:outer membrane protein W